MTSSPAGCSSRLPQILIVIVAAVLFALAISSWGWLSARPELPNGTKDVLVEGNQVRVVMDPRQEVSLLTPEPGLGSQPAVSSLATSTPAILPTSAPATPLPPLPTAPPPGNTPIPQAACILFTSYQVQAGDTLFSISRRFVTSITLMARHGISSTSLVPGAIIEVPVGDPSCCSGGWRPYVVEDGETWSNIAFNSGVTTEVLMQTNGRAPGEMLYLASVICTP